MELRKTTLADVWGIDQWRKDWGHEASWEVALVISTYAKTVRST